MNIGIDIDDTTFVTVNSMIKYADKYDKEIVGGIGINGELGLIQNRYYLNNLYDWNDKTKFEFFDMYYKNVLEECTPMPDSPEIINKLKENNKIFFITARLDSIKNCDAEKITIDMLKKYNINYDKLIINAKDKLIFCKENNIEIFIEDSFDTCKELECDGIKTYLMTTKMNKNINSGTIERVNNWKELYEKIEDYIAKSE